MKLRTRLLSIFLAVSLIPLMVFSAVSVTAFITKSGKDTYQLNESKLKIAEAEINWLIEESFNLLNTISSQPSVRNFDVTNIKKILRKASEINSDIVIALANIKGDQVIKSNDDELANVGDREYFQQVINGNERYVSNVLSEKITEKLMVVLSIPARDLADKIVGILQANIYLSVIGDLVADLSEDGSTVYVLSGDGKVMAHPNAEYMQNREDFSALDFVKAGLRGENASLRSQNITGEKVIVSSSLNEMTGWLIVVETPVSIAMQSAYRLLNISIILFICAVIVVVICGSFFSRSISRPLVKISSVMKSVAGGDLKDFYLNIKSKDEIGQLYNSVKIMTQNLRDLVGNIQTVSTSLASQSQQLFKATDETTQSLTQVVTTIGEMAQGNSDQAMMIQGTTDAINKVNNIVSNATIKTEGAAGKAKESLDLAVAGRKAIERQSQKIEENNRYTNSVGESIQELAAMADEIHNIIGVINGIAEQTNLLSLNASIEAARAGEAGRGFAVVADEIRKLAEQSGKSTKKIEDIVRSINGKIEETVGNMMQVKESVLAMEASVSDTNESFDRIFDSITELAQIVREVNTAFVEISNQTREVADQATNISAVVEEASASMQEISASSEEQLASMETIAQSSGQLENMARELLTQVGKFKVD